MNIKIIILSLLITLLLILLTSCRTVKNNVESVKSDSTLLTSRSNQIDVIRSFNAQNQTDLRRDSVIIIMRNDSVIIREKTIIEHGAERIKLDTVLMYINKIDSIYINNSSDKNSLKIINNDSLFDKIKNGIGNFIFFILIGILIGFIIVKYIIKK